LSLPVLLKSGDTFLGENRGAGPAAG